MAGTSSLSSSQPALPDPTVTEHVTDPTVTEPVTNPTVTEPVTKGNPSVTKQVKQLARVIIRFAGDSGDGMQLTGDRFTEETAVFGNDLSTLPDFPAEIRAPAGTLPGVSVVPAALRRPRHPDPG